MLTPKAYQKASVVLLWCLSVCIVVVVAWAVVTYSSQPDFEHALLYPGNGKPLPEFELHGAGDTAFGREHLEGTWSLVFFGYTRCPDICPVTLQTMHRTAERLRERGAPEPQYLFVSVDSRRDDTRQLKNYVDYFDKAFTGLTADAAGLKKLSKAFEAPFNYYTLEENSQFEYVNHSASIYVVSPNVRLYAVLPAPHSPAQIANDMARLRKHYRQSVL